MYTDYLDDVKQSAFKGVFTLFKKSVKYHAAVYLGFFILSLIITLMSANSLMSVNNPIEMSQKYQSFFLNYGGWLILIVPIALLVGAWLYTLGLSINDNVVRSENGVIGSAFRSSFSGITVQMFLYLLLLIGVYIIGALGLALVVALFSAISKVIGVILAVIAVIAFMVFYMRFLAGPAYIVHGKEGAVEALKASFKSITWVRALIICVISVGLIFVFYFIMFAILLMMGMNIFNPESMAEMAQDPSMSEFGTTMILYQVLNFVFAVVIYSFVYAAISSLYFRYNSPDSQSEDEQVGEHLITE